MTTTTNFAISFASLLVSVLIFRSAMRMNAYQRHEYAFFLSEYKEKLGKTPGRMARLQCWNAALGGKAPKWHWICPVVSPRDSFQTAYTDTIINNE